MKERTLACKTFIVMALGLIMIQASSAAASTDEETRWKALHSALFDQRPMRDGAGVISLEAPYRAHDAALVPITITADLAQTPDRYIKTITLLIDENPSPVAGVFEMTPMSGVASIRTRVRVNAYTHVRAIAETNDGTLFLATKFVKASGGCSAPAMKDPDAALARLGKMKLRYSEAPRLNQPNEAQLLISHPNSTGMQMDQVTRHYIPAHYVRDITVRYGDETVFKVTSDISLSEDPSIHFHYVPEQAGEITAEVVDTKGAVYTRSWSITPQ